MIWDLNYILWASHLSILPSISSVDLMERKRSQFSCSSLAGIYWFAQPGPDLVQGHCPALPLGPDEDSWCRRPETLTSFVMMIINMYVSFRDWFKTEYSWSIAQLADWIRILCSTKGVCYLGQLIVTQPAQHRAQYTATTPQPSLAETSRGRDFIRKVFRTFIFLVTFTLALLFLWFSV